MRRGDRDAEHSYIQLDPGGAGRRVSDDRAGDFHSAVDIASHEVPVIVLVPADVYDRAVYRTRGAGVFVLARPVRGQILVQSANLLLTSHRRIAELRADNDRLSRRMEELGLITRAKCLLIEKKGMTEETAHRYLETEAMNHSLTKREVAQQVLRELD